MSSNRQWKVPRTVLTVLIVLIFLVTLILYNRHLGLFVKEIEFPGFVRMLFGEKSPTSQLQPRMQPVPAPADRAESEKSLASQPQPRTQPSAVVLEIRSNPPGADTYLDWKRKGQTPVTLQGTDVSGLLVVVKEGYRAAFRRIDSRERGQVEFTLPRDGVRSRTRLLILVPENASADAFSSLRSRLVEEGFAVLGTEEAEEFQQELSRAGGLSHRGLRGWARERFDTDLLVLAKFRQSNRELGDQEPGFSGIREAVRGIVRTEVSVNLELIDLRSGDHLSRVSGTGSSFALDRAQALQKALTQAITESAQLLRKRIGG